MVGMSPFDVMLIRVVDEARRDLCGVTATTRSIQARLPLAVPDRSLRYYLAKLERAGYVERPLGQKSGWALSHPVRVGMRARRMAA